LLLIVTVALGCSGAHPPGAASTRGEALMRAGSAAHDAGKFEAAIGAWEGALGIDLK